VLERPLRWLATILSLIIAVSFVLFAVEDLDRASEDARSRVAGGFAATDPTPAAERERERRHGDLREAIDDANDVVLKPFAPISDGAESRWVRRGVPALLGLLVYGFGLSYAARFTRGRG
jgi:CO/xanthine dehydrogenase FAD-binding subunit